MLFGALGIIVSATAVVWILTTSSKDSTSARFSDLAQTIAQGDPHFLKVSCDPTPRPRSGDIAFCDALVQTMNGLRDAAVKVIFTDSAGAFEGTVSWQDSNSGNTVTYRFADSLSREKDPGK